MEILKFESVARPARKKTSRSKAFLGLASVAAIALLGSTLAANISLNSGGTVEFGQGVALTASCDTDGITATPTATFANAANGGGFNFSTVAFSNIASTCLEKTFTLKAYGDTSATPLTLATVTSASYSQATFKFTTSAVTSLGINTDARLPYSGTYTVGFQGTQATSGAVAKLTLESQ